MHINKPKTQMIMPALNPVTHAISRLKPGRVRIVRAVRNSDTPEKEIPVGKDFKDDQISEVGSIIPLLTLSSSLNSDGTIKDVQIAKDNKGESSDSTSQRTTSEDSSAVKANDSATVLLSKALAQSIDQTGSVNTFIAPFYFLYRLFVNTHAIFTAASKMAAGGDPVTDAYVKYFEELGITGAEWTKALNTLTDVLNSAYKEYPVLGFWDGSDVNESAKARVICDKIAEALNRYRQNSTGGGTRILIALGDQMSDILMVFAWQESSFQRTTVDGPANERRLGYFHLQEWIAKAYTDQKYAATFKALGLDQPKASVIKPQSKEQYLTPDEEIALMACYLVEVCTVLENKVAIPAAGTAFSELKYKDASGKQLIDKDFPQSGNYYYDLTYLIYYYGFFGPVFGKGSPAHLKVLSRKQFNYILLRIARTYSETTTVLGG